MPTMHNSPRTATVTATTSLSDLAEDWLISLEAEGKSRATLAAYGQATTAFVAWHREQGTAEPQLDRATATAFLADLRRNGSRPRDSQAAVHGAQAVQQMAGDRGRDGHRRAGRSATAKAGQAQRAVDV